MFSHSRVSCFEKCPYQYWLRYVEKYRTLPDQEPDNALYLGLGLHKGIETTVDEGLKEYFSYYYMLTDAHINWSMQLEHQIPKVKELLPEGEHEIKIDTDDFIGFIDYVSEDTLFDFKFSNNVHNYTSSPQLSLYKYYYELTHPGKAINHLKYIFVPKLKIRQKKTETLPQFRQRLLAELEKSEIQILEVPYSHAAVLEFQESCETITSQKSFPKNPTKLCGWCSFQNYCENGETHELFKDMGELDYVVAGK